MLEVAGKKLLGKAIDEKGTVIDTFSKDVP
jgi:hypothetical protein